MDRISDLPDALIEKILCLLPLRGAVKTCVLAKAWRHKWVRRPKLVFHDQFWLKRSNGKDKREEESEEDEVCRRLNILSAILLQHIGVLDELYLELPEIPLTAESEDIIIPSIQFALRKGVKTLCLKHCPIPAFVYSYTQLTSLELIPPCKQTCSLPTSFEGLPNLVSFSMDSVHVSYETDDDRLVHFLSKCPKIKTVRLTIQASENLQFRAPSLEYLSIGGFLACICFPDVNNLKRLDIDVLYVVDGTRLAKKCRRMKIFSRLVKLESLKLQNDALKLLALSGAPKRVKGCLQNLKDINAEELSIRGLDELRFLLCLLASSPNLHQLAMSFERERVLYNEEMMMEIDSYRDHKFENLHSVQIYPTGCEFDIKMIELLLYCSPNLKSMSVCCSFFGLEEEEELDMSDELFEKVLGFTRASANVSFELR